MREVNGAIVNQMQIVATYAQEEDSKLCNWSMLNEKRNIKEILRNPTKCWKHEF